MKINMKEKAKKLFYKLLKNGKIVDAYFKHITYQHDNRDGHKPYIGIKWTWTEKPVTFKNPLTLESTFSSYDRMQFENEGSCLSYFLVIGGRQYFIELDDTELAEVSFIVSKTLRDFQENTIDSIYNSIHSEPDPLYGNLLENEDE
jgi:hypothetical protein